LSALGRGTGKFDAQVAAFVTREERFIADISGARPKGSNDESVHLKDKKAAAG
jgi:hypothetical protein